MYDLRRERDTDSLKPLWLILDGPMDYKWTETIETIIGVKRKMNLHSGEELHVPRNMQMIFETSSIEKVFYILLITIILFQKNICRIRI